MTTSRIEHHVDPNVAFASLRNVVIVVFRGPPRIEDVERMGSIVRQLAPKYPRGLGVFQVSMRETSGGRGTPDIRRAFTAMMRDVTPIVRAAAIVVKTPPFVAAAIRAVAGGVVLLAKPSVQFLIFHDTREASDWLTAKLAQLGAPLEEHRDLPLAVLETIASVK